MLEETGEGVTMKFALTDTGPGIPEDKQSGIFDLRLQSGGGGVAEQGLRNGSG